VLAPEDVADRVIYMVTRPATPPSAKYGLCPPASPDRSGISRSADSAARRLGGKRSARISVAFALS
jgi:hypothetical protein